MNDDDFVGNEMSAEDFGERASAAIKDGHAVILLDFDEEGSFSILSNFSQTDHILSYLRASAIQAFMQAGYDFFSPGIAKEPTATTDSSVLH